MKRVLLLGVCFVILYCSMVQAETYFIREGGTASASVSAQSSGGSCASLSKAMSISTHNSAAFKPGDVIYICGIMQSPVQLVPPSSGSSAGYITYRGDHPGYAGSFEQQFSYPGVMKLVSIKSKEYLAFESLNFNAHRTALEGSYASIWIEGLEVPSRNIRVDDCDFAESVNGVSIRGNSHYITVTRSTFRDMTQNGVHFGYYYQRNDVGMPSHIIVGGSREEGNEFVNCGFLGCNNYKSCETCVNNVCLKGDSSGSVPGSALGEQASDVVISYNHIYSNKDKWGGGGMYLNGVQRFLIENNYIHDFYAQNSRGRISLKSDFSWKNSDIIIRFNKLASTYAVTPSTSGYTEYSSGLRFNNCLDNVVVYGNLIRNVPDSGIFTTWGWNSEYSSDGCIPENVYVFSNIIDTTHSGSGLYVAGTSGSDHFRNTYFNNNLFYHIAYLDAQSNPSSNYGIQLVGADRNYQGVHVKNNVIDTPRLPASDSISIKASFQNDVFFDYNHHHSTEEEVSVHYDGTDCAPCLWNSNKVPGNYGDHDSSGDPLFIDPSRQKFGMKAGSPLIDSGEKQLVQIRPMIIHGVTYSPHLGEGLDPIKTDWSQTIPVVFTLNQGLYGSGWEKGPYVYVDVSQDTQTTCFPAWTCTSWGSWSVCAEGLQSRTRVCSDSNLCGVDTGKPSETETQSCQMPVADTKNYHAYRTRDIIILDGDLLEFGDAQTIVLTSPQGTRGTYSFLWDDEYLYVGADIEDRQLNSVSSTTDATTLWSDDSLELMFDTAHNGGTSLDYSNDYKMFINSRGIKGDTKRYDPAWESGVQSVVVASGTHNQDSDSDEGYVIEARIPFTGWVSVQTDTAWGMNVALNDRYSSGNDQVVWSGASSNNPSDAGTLVFSGVEVGGTACASLSDVISAITQWKNGARSMQNLMDVIKSWRGC